MTEAYPLQWPDGWPRTPARQLIDGRSKFGRATGGSAVKRPITIHQATQSLLDELRPLGADTDNVVISSDLRLRLDGLPYSNQREPGDPGVAVYFMMDGEQTVMARDAYDRIADNLRSLALAISALRQLDRHGGGTMLKRAFAGFQALPPPGAGTAINTPPPWWDVLDVSPDASLAERKAAWRSLTKRLHPDNQDTGNADKFQQVQDAWAQAQVTRS